MKRSHYLLLFLFLFSFFPLWSTTYYLDFTNGSNANDGMSPETAWKDLFKIRAAFPAPGDTFLFKRGEIWEGLQMYIDASGTAEQPIVYGAYGEETDPLPIISNVQLLEGASEVANWTSTSPNIWSLSLPDSPGRLFLDGVEYLRASTLADLGNPDNEGAFAYWFYEDGTDELHLYASQNPASLYSEIKGNKLFISVLVFNADHLVFDHLDLRGGSGTSLDLKASSHIGISNCHLGRWSNSGLTLQDWPIDGVRVPSSHITVSDNTFDSDFTFFYGLGSERGCGDGVKLFYGVNNCVVANNSFRNWAHNAIELLADRADADGVYANQFYDNYITAPDIPYAHPFGADGLMDKCTQNEFYQNHVEDCRTSSQINGNNNWVHHNIIKGMRNSPSKISPTAHAFTLGIYQPNFVCQDNRFDHNLIIDTDESAFIIRGFGLQGLVQNNAIRNNIFYKTGQAPKTSSYQYDEGTNLVIFDQFRNEVGGNTYQNNLFYSPQAADNAVYIQYAAIGETTFEGSYYSTDAFNALNGIDGNVIENNLFGKPRFINPRNGNFLPQASSPAVNAGIDVGIALDFSGNPRIVGSVPDIGPFETHVGDVWSDIQLRVLGRGRVQLRWEGFSKRLTRYYLVERKVGDRPWKHLRRVAARGNGNRPISYLITDKNPPEGLVAYRILRMDKNGECSYSETVSAVIGNNRQLALARTNSETLDLLADEQWDWANTSIQVFRHDGRPMGVIKGASRIRLNELPTGMYYLLIQGNGELEVKRFIR